MLRLSQLSKTFVGQQVLSDVSLTVGAGEVHGLIGENGSGKSTLVKILAGYHAPDPGGTVTVADEPVEPGSPASSEARGLRFVHQDLGLVESLNAVENLALGPGYRRSRTGFINWRRERDEAHAALRRFGHDVDVTVPVGELPMSSRTAIAVVRALSARKGEPRVLVLDEPTANLPSHESQLLFQLIHRVSGSGVAVVLVSHRLDEIVANCSRVSVLRDGVLVWSGELAGRNQSDLVELMIGQQVDAAAVPLPPRAGAAPVLAVRGLTTATIAELSVEVGAGEVVGIAGITGSGREEAAPAIFGGTPRSGTVTVGGRLVPALRPDRAIASGVGLVPAQRHTNAIFPDAVVRENVSVAGLRSRSTGWLIRPGAERAGIQEWLRRLDVRPPDPERMIITLSGGNQQKVVLARVLRQHPKVLILDEPTQGVDVGAKAEIHALVDEAARDGAAVVVASTESEELARLCTRVLVLQGGRVASVLEGADITTERITAATLDTEFRQRGRAPDPAEHPGDADDF
jgi:ribose transport system ATP-binding protein